MERVPNLTPCQDGVDQVTEGPRRSLDEVRITAKVDYAVRAAIELAAQGGSQVKGEQLAERQKIPLKYLENILADLRRSGVVASQRGADGGYRLAQPAEAVSVADIIRAVEGPLADVRGISPDEIEYPGPAKSLQRVWVATRAALRAVLEEVTIADIATGSLPSAFDDLLADPEAWSRRSLRGRAAAVEPGPSRLTGDPAR
jgi:Rrf2 family protein